jgi:[acyl-carrier-protein] S-malonyltransferase
MLAVAAPGQGSQTPGMLSPWLELPGAAELMAGFSEVSGLDLVRLGTTADADEIKDTAVTQPLIVALSLLAAAQLELSEGTMVAGHSVGELAAAAMAGSLEPDAAVAFAARRGAEMAAACALTPTGMSAVLGGTLDEVLGVIAQHGLTAANRNGGGQVVAAGSVDGLAALAANPPAGARVRPLPVAGAFHTHYMSPAEDALADFAQNLTARNPTHVLLSNADGAALSTGHGVLGRLVRQVTRAVRWDLCQESMRQLGITALIELPPSGALVGLAKRAMPGVETLAIKSPADLDAARALIAATGRTGQGEHTPDFHIAVTPAKGVFTRAAGIDEGSPVKAGMRLGTIATNRDEHAVLAPASGPGGDLVLAEWLRHDGDIVAAGLPVARINTATES